MDEGAKNKQGEGDIKEKLVISTMNKDLVSRNEKVQVQVKPLEPLSLALDSDTTSCDRKSLVLYRDQKEHYFGQSPRFVTPPTHTID